MTIYFDRMTAAKNIDDNEENTVGYAIPKAKDAVNNLLDRYFEKRCEKIAASVQEVVSKKKETDPSLKAPKKWWDSMVKQIKKGNPDYSAEQVKKTVGSIWTNLSDAKKSEIRKREGKTYGPAKTAASFLSRVEAASSIPKLTPEQFSEIKKEMVKDGHPVRFLYNGQALDIVNGELAAKGSNVIYHPMYWNFTKDTANKIAKWLKVKPVFDQG